MMLASPLLPTQASAFSTQRSSDDGVQYRPAKNIDEFKTLLPPPIEFVEGSSTGALAVPLGKYEPINESPKPGRTDRNDISKPSPSVPAKSVSAQASSLNNNSASLFPGGIDTSWPEKCNRGSGLYNSGNTCFLNSALQCLLHTPPLLRMLILHSRDSCRIEKGFCMICSLRSVMQESYRQRSAFSPTAITAKLHFIAKHMRHGRQEDSHEFLRYAIDALQRSCLAGYPPKLDPKVAETTWVHKIFGGRLRSRVTCHSCGHNSDTFDRILDLSVDIHRAETLKDALRKFVAVDYLKGADKYKCEKCQKHVNAQKNFTLHEAPLVLTVHLKRFSPMGRKIGHYVFYDDELSLQPYMSDGRFGPTYSLYGIICHAGSGPNSGHYYAFVKNKDGHWWEMNDESVSRIASPPVGKKNAYMLFYMRNKGQAIEAAVNAAPTTPTAASKLGLVAGMKKRKEREDATEDGTEDVGVKVSKPFIGPLLPAETPKSPYKKQRTGESCSPTTTRDKPPSTTPGLRAALSTLNEYTSDSDESRGKGEKEEEKEIAPSSEAPPLSSSPTLPPSSSPATVPPDRFYVSPGKKSWSTEASRSDSRSQGSSIIEYRRKYGHSLNPYNRMSSKKFARRPRGL